MKRILGVKRTTPKYIIRQGTKSKELSTVADKGAMKYQKEARRISSKKLEMECVKEVEKEKGKAGEISGKEKGMIYLDESIAI